MAESGKATPVSDDDGKQRGEYAGRLWTIGNAIVAFAVAQAFSALYTILKEHGVQCALHKNFFPVALGVAASHAIYSFGVWYAGLLEARLHDRADLRRTSALTARLRIAALAFLAASTILVFWAIDPTARGSLDCPP